MAMVYGIFTGYVSFANKLKRKYKIEAQTKYLILDGILLINEGCAPNMLTEKLATYLSQTERDKYFPESKEAM